MKTFHTLMPSEIPILSILQISEAQQTPHKRLMRNYLTSKDTEGTNENNNAPCCSGNFSDTSVSQII
jgi:hypothetical protein